MREIIAKLVAALTVVVVVGLSLLFAAKHNPGASATPEVSPVEKIDPRPAGAADAAPIAAKPSDLVGRGRAVYAQQNCATCHSIAGEGNPRAPLDDVGVRLDAAELRAWITGTGVAADVLAPAIVKRKQRYLSIPSTDLEALIGYLATLKAAK